MQTLRVQLIVLLCAFLAAAILVRAAVPQRVSLLVTGGTVVTVDAARHVYRPGAVAIRFAMSMCPEPAINSGNAGLHDTPDHP